MIECKESRKDGDAYLEQAKHLLIHYIEELPIRIEKSKMLRNSQTWHSSVNT